MKEDHNTDLRETASGEGGGGVRVWVKWCGRKVGNGGGCRRGGVRVWKRNQCVVWEAMTPMKNKTWLKWNGAKVKKKELLSKEKEVKRKDKKDKDKKQTKERKRRKDKI